MALQKAQEMVSSNPVVVFRFFSFLSVSFICIWFFIFYYSINLIGFWNNSKTYCPFCVSVKKLLSELGATFKVVELDTESKFFIFPFLYSFHHPLSISLSPLLFYCLRSFNFSTGNELVRMTCGKLLCIQTCPNWVPFCFMKYALPNRDSAHV